MGLSFHEMQAAAQEMSLRAVFDEDLSNYTLCDDGRYEVYTEYTDDAVSEVDKHKKLKKLRLTKSTMQKHLV